MLGDVAKIALLYIRVQQHDFFIRFDCVYCELLFSCSSMRGAGIKKCSASPTTSHSLALKDTGPNLPVRLHQEKCINAGCGTDIPCNPNWEHIQRTEPDISHKRSTKYLIGDVEEL